MNLEQKHYYIVTIYLQLYKITLPVDFHQDNKNTYLNVICYVKHKTTQMNNLI